MPVNKCRVCKNDFFAEPLLRYENMPAAAQYMPDAESFNSDNGVELEVYQCSACGLVQLSNDPVWYYKEVIRAAAISKEMINFRVTQFGEFIDKYSLGGKKIIEIGCGRGEYISVFQNFNIDVHGLEFSEESVRYCIKNGLKVEKGFVESRSTHLKYGPFDAFFILNFFEHLPDPNTTLAGIHHNLNNGAVGLIEVPNFDMILRKNLFSEFIGDHLFYFTKDTLTTTLNRSGFEVIACRETWHDYIISAIVKKRGELDLSSFCRHQEEKKKEIADYISRFKHKNVAIWGAGHQALAVISLAHIAGRIKYVVDSAAFKQGKFTPASHLPIVSPDMLNADPVEAVIIMAAGYSDEVADNFREKYQKILHVAILRNFGLEEVF